MKAADALRRAAFVPTLLAVLVPGSLRAQGPDEPVVIDHADQIERIARADSLTYVLTGNVRAHRGPLYMRSQRAVIFRDSGVAEFTRDVRFWDVSNEIYADHVVYDETTDVAVATGNVQVIDRESGSNVTADTVRYERRTDVVKAWPRPHAVVMSRDTTAAAEPFDVWADTMRLVSDSTRTEFVAVRKVLIERSDLTAVGDSLHYDDAGEIVALRIDPRVETAETYLTADHVDVLFAADEIDALVAVDGARAVQKADSVPAAVPAAFGGVADASYMEGDSLYIAFADEGIDWLTAEGRARSLNYTRESQPGPVETWSVNYLLGGKLTLNFRADTLQRVVATGGSRGVYRQERVRMGGPERRPSEPIPLEPTATARTVRAPRLSAHAGRRLR